MYVIVYDFGTSAVKTCLFEISSTIRLICHTNAEYGLYIIFLKTAVQSRIRKNGGMRSPKPQGDFLTRQTLSLGYSGYILLYTNAGSGAGR